MKFGLLSGILWGLDTCILGIAFLYHPFNSALDAALVCAAVHDIISALVLITLVVARGKFSQFLQALRTKGALIICCGALMSGPVGMNAYMSSINNIGPAPTAIISAFYPAVGTFLAVFFLKESMNTQRLVALFVALAGVIMVGLQTAQGSVEGNTIIGVAAAFICVLAWGSGAVFASWGLQSTQDLDCDVALLIHELTSSLTYALIVLPLVGAWGFVAQMSVVPASIFVIGAGVAGALSYLFYYKAIDVTGAARAMACNISYCAWALIFSSLYAATMPNLMSIICCIAIFVGTILSATPDWSVFLPQTDKHM